MVSQERAAIRQHTTRPLECAADNAPPSTDTDTEGPESVQANGMVAPT